MFLMESSQPLQCICIHVEQNNLSDVFLNVIYLPNVLVPKSDLMDITFSNPEFTWMDLKDYGASDLEETRK